MMTGWLIIVGDGGDVLVVFFGDGDVDDDDDDDDGVVVLLLLYYCYYYFDENFETCPNSHIIMYVCVGATKTTTIKTKTTCTVSPTLLPPRNS
jgi:hypothetical protein